MHKNSSKILRLIGIIFVFLLIQFDVNASNRVTSVNAYQKGNDIIIEYELSKGADIELYLYVNGTLWKSLKQVYGDVGKNILPGKKRITWEVLKEYNNFKYDNVQFKVYSYGKVYVPWKNIIMANGGFTTLPDYSFGLTYARVKKAGFYFSAMSNFNFRFNGDYKGDSSTSINGIFPMYSGKKEYTKITATAGLVVRFAEPIYMYLGGGYGYRGLFYETTNKDWVEIHNKHSIYHGGVGEVGLIGNIYGFSLSLGLSVITDFKNYYPEAKVGVGYCF